MNEPSQDSQTKETGKKDSGVHAPTISLPKGGGAIRGKGEKSAANPVTGTGSTAFNNKRKPVRQYEPFFSQLPDKRHRFEFGAMVGVSPIVFYDLDERVVATLHPNYTYEKVFVDPWQQTPYDVNDTVAANDKKTGDPHTDPDIKGHVDKYFKTQPSAWQTWYQERLGGAKGPEAKAAAEKAAKHDNTPTRAHFDALGCTFLTVAHIRFDRQNPNGGIETVNEEYLIRIVFDIEVNQREVIDSKGRVVMRHDYHIAGPEEGKEDAAGHGIHQDSMDAGERFYYSPPNVAEKKGPRQVNLWSKAAGKRYYITCTRARAKDKEIFVPVPDILAAKYLVPVPPGKENFSTEDLELNVKEKLHGYLATPRGGFLIHRPEETSQPGRHEPIRFKLYHDLKSEPFMPSTLPPRLGDLNPTMAKLLESLKKAHSW